MTTKHGDIHVDMFVPGHLTSCLKRANINHFPETFIRLKEKSFIYLSSRGVGREGYRPALPGVAGEQEGDDMAAKQTREGMPGRI